MVAFHQPASLHCTILDDCTLTKLFSFVVMRILCLLEHLCGHKSTPEPMWALLSPYYHGNKLHWLDTEVT